MTTEFRFDDAALEIGFDEEAPLVEPEAPVEAPAEHQPGKVDPEPEQEGISDELKAEYMEVYDAIMFEEKYEKVIKLGKKYTAVLCSRSADADVKISRQLDSMNFQTVSTYQTVSAVLTLSHSLVEFCGTDLRDRTPGQRYEFVRSKTSHIVELLSKHMVEFDMLIRDALAYGELNF